MKKPAVCVPFVSGRYDEEISACAKKLGFEAHHHNDVESLLPQIADYEAIYGDVGPAALKGVPDLR